MATFIAAQRKKRSYGVRELGASRRVDSNTQFQLASTSKPITTMLAGTLIDQGAISWATTTKSLLPNFQVADAAATNTLRIEHMFCQCTSVPRRDWDFI